MNMNAAIKQSDKVIYVDPSNLPESITGMLRKIMPSMLVAHGFYAVNIGGEKVVFVKAVTS